MKIQHLRFFTAVIANGGVTQAAARLRVSQPAISAGLKALEQELGEPLFARSGGRRRMTATAKAMRFHAQAVDILARCDDARATFRKEPIVEIRRIRIGMLNTLPADALAAVTASLAPVPGHRWQFREGKAADMARWLRQDKIDVAWTVLDARTSHAEILWREPFVVLAARGSALAKRRGRRNIRDLAGERLILRGACELKSGALAAAGVKLSIAATADRDDLALRLVAAGAGIAVAPLSLATREAVAVPIHDLGIDRAIGLRWRPGLPSSALEAIRAAVKKLGAPG